MNDENQSNSEPLGVQLPAAQVAPAEAAPAKQLTPEEQHKQIQQMRMMIFVAHADAERKKLAVNRGLLKDGKATAKLIALGAAKETIAAGHGIAFDDVEQVKPEDLRYFVPLPGDDMVYAIDPKTKMPRLALDKFGLIAFPKGKGRRHKHLNRREMNVKAAALAVFPVLFAEHGGKLLLAAKAAAEKEGKEWKQDDFFGIPEADMPKLYQDAANMGMQYVATKEKRERRVRRRQQQLSRRINAQQLPSGSVPAHKYFIFGVPGHPGKPCRAVVIRKEQEAAAAAAKKG